MLEYKFIKQILAFAFAAALVYCIAAGIYIKRMSFDSSWILYIGNFLFAAVIAIFIGWFYKKHETVVSTIRLVVIGAKTAVAGIAMSCAIVFLLMFILVPSIFRPEAVSHIELQHSPGQFSGKNDGFGAILFFNAVVGNAGAAFFISLLIPFAVMKNLYGDEKKEKNNEAVSKRNENPKTNFRM